MPRIRPEVRGIVPYKPGKPIEEVARELGLEEIIKLASNECPLAPFPEVQAAIAAATTELNRYPDNERFRLRLALSDNLAVPPDHIWFGAGSTELLVAAAQVVGGPGTSAVYAWPSFVMYRIATRLAGAEAIEVPLDAEFRHDLAAMAAAVRPDTSVVYVCNPNNPTGTHVPGSEVGDLIDRLPDDVLAVVDEAYYDYAQAADYGSMLSRALERPNVIVARTFSKVYGLAGLRVGYAIGDPDTIAELRKAQAPFSVNTLAQVAAIEALRHPDRVEERIRANAEGLKLFHEELTARGIVHADSQTNFVYLVLDRDGGELKRQLLELGVIVRPMSGGAVRVTVGTEPENRRFFAALDLVLASP